MASACVNNVGVSTEAAFLDCPSYTSYGWLSPRISFSRDFPEEPPRSALSAVDKASAAASVFSEEKPAIRPAELPDLEISTGKEFVDFEFRLDDPVAMLPADELFSEGKLVPLQLASSAAVSRPQPDPAADVPSPPNPVEIRSAEARVSSIGAVVSGSDGYIFSPKAPRCSSRWKELLGLKRLQNPKSDLQKPSVTSKNANPRSFKQFLHRNPKSTPSDTSLSLPLLRENSDSEAVSISSRLSLSSSSSGPDHEDLPRISLDSDKLVCQQIPISIGRNPPRVRVTKPKTVTATTTTASDASKPSVDHPAAVRVGRSPMRRSSADATPAIPSRGASVDSPRMNSSGKVVFQSLERSSSSPGSFNGSRPIKYRPMERSYSANVRITPVLNVPVCSLRGSSKSGSVFGLGQLFSPQKREQSAQRPNGGARSSRNERL
ncbi:hypothetical protein QJS10_CPA01g00837 [Acorus calamus]|uniref:Uncharacterized protein n=1 Tax=Acorus calamus TaxID=4465 RepID=A0AAV9FKD5_ACOCL|nr:hypothetical protein QJS10_CPA01g00837 [Acorus calamus]